MTSFESAKQAHGNSEHGQKWSIPLGNVEDNVANGIKDGDLKLTRYGSGPSVFPPRAVWC